MTNKRKRKVKKGVLRQVSQLGHPALRRKARPVNNIGDGEVQRLIDDLLMTVKDVDGVGIAAPQVYEPLQIFIVASYPNPRYPKAPKMKPTAIVNPRVLSRSKSMIKDWEGCLSVPGIRGLVPRHKTITVEYKTRDGKTQKKTFKDFIARIFQHEYDHLYGMVYLDRLEMTRDIISEKEYLRMMKKKGEKKKKNKKLK